MITVGKVTDFLETVAPLELAAEWDNVGLLMGRRDAEVQRVMTCLTVTLATVEEAVQTESDLVISHHPILFHPLKRLTNSTPEGGMLLTLAQQGVAVYSAHTAYDNAPAGINETIAGLLHLQDIVPLRARQGPQHFKVAVFVPTKDLAGVSNALFAAGAGNIGLYEQCSFRVPGTGTFFGSESTNPSVGEKGRREEVDEFRLEVVCPANRLGEAIARMRQAHSYEEPAFDVYPLQAAPSALGEGRIGRLPPMNNELAGSVRLGDFAAKVKTVLHANSLQLVGDPAGFVERVGVVCGAGGGFVADAVVAGADVLLTGEARFHECLAAQASGLNLVLPGHYASERLGMESLAGRLKIQFPALTVWASRQEHDPLSSV